MSGLFLTQLPILRSVVRSCGSSVVITVNCAEVHISTVPIILIVTHKNTRSKVETHMFWGGEHVLPSYSLLSRGDDEE